MNKVYRTNITAIAHTLVWPFTIPFTYNGYTLSLCKVETATRLLKCFPSSLPECLWQEACSQTALVAEIEIIPWCLIFSNLSTPIHLYSSPLIKSIHIFKRIILVKLVLLWKWKCKIRKLLSSHVLLSSFLLRSSRTALQAKVYRIFNHANWPIKTRYFHWLCSNTKLSKIDATVSSAVLDALSPAFVLCLIAFFIWPPTSTISWKTTLRLSVVLIQQS